jgi:hypothetical protein
MNEPIRPQAPVDLEELSLADILHGLRRLKLKSILWMAGGAVTAFLGVYSLGLHFGSSGPTGKGDGEPQRQIAFASGITAISEAMSNEQLKTFLAQARSRVRIVVPWFVDPLTVKEALAPLLESGHSTVQIFFLDPDSSYLKERGKIARADLEDYGKNEMLRSVALLAPSFAKSKAAASLFTYDSLPAAFLVQVDERGLIGFHMRLSAGICRKVVLTGFFEIPHLG